MLRPSFVPPPPIRRLRDLTRYRADLVAARTAEKNRVEKLLEDAQIKLSVVASDIFGVSGRAMLAALIAGERDPKVLAQLARRRLRAKLSQLEEAFHGRFSDHHAFLLDTMLGRIDQASADIAVLEAHIEGGDRVALPGELLGQVPQRLGCPPQRRFRVTALVRLDQRQQGWEEVGVLLGGGLASPTWPADAAGRERRLAGLQLEHALADGRLADASHLRDRAHATVP
jgi:hypothetical protein